MKTSILSFPKCFLPCERKKMHHLSHKAKTCLLVKGLPFPKQALAVACLQKKSFENSVGIGEIAHKEQFLLLPQRFLPFPHI